MDDLESGGFKTGGGGFNVGFYCITKFVGQEENLKNYINLPN